MGTTSDILNVLTEMERRAIDCKARGMGKAQTAELLGVSHFRVRNLWNKARHRLLDAMTPADREFYRGDHRPLTKPRPIYASRLI